jgi:hypothetical protein
MRSVFLWALTALAVNGQRISTSGSCGAASGGLTCAGSTFGSCCSKLVRLDALRDVANVTLDITTAAAVLRIAPMAANPVTVPAVPPRRRLATTKSPPKAIVVVRVGRLA